MKTLVLHNDDNNDENNDVDNNNNNINDNNNNNGNNNNDNDADNNNNNSKSDNDNDNNENNMLIIIIMIMIMIIMIMMIMIMIIMIMMMMVMITTIIEWASIDISGYMSLWITEFVNYAIMPWKMKSTSLANIRDKWTAGNHYPPKCKPSWSIIHEYIYSYMNRNNLCSFSKKNQKPVKKYL